MKFESTAPIPPEILRWGNKMKMLMDAEFLKKGINEYDTLEEFSKVIHVSPKTLRKAMKYHQIVMVKR